MPQSTRGLLITYKGWNDHAINHLHEEVFLIIATIRRTHKGHKGSPYRNLYAPYAQLYCGSKQL